MTTKIENIFNDAPASTEAAADKEDVDAKVKRALEDVLRAAQVLVAHVSRSTVRASDVVQADGRKHPEAQGRYSLVSKVDKNDATLAATKGNAYYFLIVKTAAATILCTTIAKSPEKYKPLKTSTLSYALDVKKDVMTHVQSLKRTEKSIKGLAYDDEGGQLAVQPGGVPYTSQHQEVVAHSYTWLINRMGLWVQLAWSRTELAETNPGLLTERTGLPSIWHAVEETMERTAPLVKSVGPKPEDDDGDDHGDHALPAFRAPSPMALRSKRKRAEKDDKGDKVKKEHK